MDFPKRRSIFSTSRNVGRWSDFQHLHVVDLSSRGEAVAFAGQVNEIGSRTGGVVPGGVWPKEKVAHLIFGDFSGWLMVSRILFVIFRPKIGEDVHPFLTSIFLKWVGSTTNEFFFEDLCCPCLLK